MDEKIKISAPKALYDLLCKDCADFKVTKKDGSPNMNAFLNMVLVNFYEEFAGAEEKLRDEVRAALADVPDRYRETAFLNALKVFTKRQTDIDDGETKVFAFKPTKNAEKAVVYIENMLAPNESLSSCYRRLFSAYAQKRKNLRERIVFKENHRLLTEAAAKGIPMVHSAPIPGCETRNLQFFTERGMSVTASKIGGQIDAGQELLRDESRREKMCEAQKQVIPRDAAERIYGLLRQLSE